MGARLAGEDRLTLGRREGPGTRRALGRADRAGRDGGRRCSPRRSSARRADKRPTVQVGDPFAGKMLIEALARAARARPAGLRSRTWARPGSPARLRDGGEGRRRDGDRPRPGPPARARHAALGGVVSESQERMLCVVEPGRHNEVARGLRALGDRARADRPVTADGPLVGACPAARRSSDMPVRAPGQRVPALRARESAAGRGRPLYPGPGPRSRRRRAIPRARLCWRCSPARIVGLAPALFERYDRIVQSSTVRRPGQADAAVLALPDGSAAGVVVAIDGNGRRRAAIRTAARSRRCSRARRTSRASGARPLGLTNYLNFGNPGEAARGVLAARRGGRGAWATRAGRSGSGDRAGTCRSTTRAPQARSAPTPGSGSWGASTDVHRAGRLGSRARARRSRWSAALRASLHAERARATLAREALPDGLPELDLPGRARIQTRSATAVARGPARERARHRRRRARGGAGRVLPGGRGRRPGGAVGGKRAPASRAMGDRPGRPDLVRGPSGECPGVLFGERDEHGAARAGRSSGERLVRAGCTVGARSDSRLRSRRSGLEVRAGAAGSDRVRARGAAWYGCVGAVRPPRAR